MAAPPIASIEDPVERLTVTCASDGPLQLLVVVANARHRMNTHTAVEVFLGNPITIPSESKFLARLRHDLLTLGVSVRILANLEVGREDRQIDFVVITDHRVVQIEEKTFPGRIVDGPKNGPWRIQVGAEDVCERDNPVRQAQTATFALSDELQAFAATGSVPGPRASKFYRDIDTIVCAFPVLHKGSRFDKHKYVTVLGYDALLNRLQTPGPSVAWSAEDWDAFGRHLNLYRADDDSPEGLVRRAGAAAVDAYRGRYLQAQGNPPPLVATGVRVDASPARRPDLAGDLAAGQPVLLHGPSGFGKTPWARTAAAELARAGHVPIWLAAGVCEDSFRTSLARAIAPYTSLSPDELMRAAEAAGRGVVFVIDDLTKAADAIRQALLDGAQAVRLRDPTRGLLVTSQPANVVSSIPDCLEIELTVPDDAERRAVLDAYGAPEIIDRCEAFVSPLELSLAASSTGALAPSASAADLLDHHVDHLIDGDDRLRGGLRIIAHLMHTHLTPSLGRPDLARTLRRDHGFTDTELKAVFGCPIVTVAHGRVSFRHERFERFLAAEALLLETTDVHVLARTLNTPRCAELRADAVGLESQELRLSEILAICEHPDILVAAATGRLGPMAARVTDTLLVDTLNIACAQTTASTITFHVGVGIAFDGRWSMPTDPGPATAAQLTAIGRLVRDGRYVEGAVKLLELTDSLCDHTIANADRSIPGLADQVFAATYVFRGRKGLPASTLVHAATEPLFVADVDLQLAADAATTLTRRDNSGFGALYVAGHLLHHPTAPPIVADVIIRCLASRRYHLRLLGLQLAEDSTYDLDDSDRSTILEAIRSVPNDNLILNGSIVEALSALGDVTPARDVDDITAEIEIVLTLQQDPIGQKMAYGIVANQFECDAIGPYSEAIHALPDADRETLLAMALQGGDADSLFADWIPGQFDDLSNPVTRAAVVAYLARTEPSSWWSPQSRMGGLVAALRLLVADGAPLPDAVDGGNTDPAWRASMTVIMGALADAVGGTVDEQAVVASWKALVGEHRGALASLLSNLRHMHGTRSHEPGEVHELVVAAMPADGIDVLVWSLQHPDQVRSLCGHDLGLRSYVISMLGRLGDRRAADVLRRLADDPEDGEAAAVAVRSIETRAVA
jgi:hypothetical protein